MRKRLFLAILLTSLLFNAGVVNAVVTKKWEIILNGPVNTNIRPLAVQSSFAAPTSGKYNLRIEVFNAANRRVARVDFKNQELQAGKARSYTFNWNANNPRTEKHTIKASVFNSKNIVIASKSKITVVKSVSLSRTTTTPKSIAPIIAGCQIFPNDNPWNQEISKLPVHKNSNSYINSIGATKKLHPDFGENQTYGIPITIVENDQAKVPITFTAYGDESDPGPYPIPGNARIEGGENAGGDRHILVLQKNSCILYELFNARKTGRGWSADSGAVFDLRSNKLRPKGWTSADAAGLPILPGLVRYEEVAAGEIKHAIRFTAPRTQRGFIEPATHFAGSNNPALPPMGLRVRLKANYDISQLKGQAKVIATAMKKYGLVLADNGSPWFFQGATDPHWNDDQLNQLKKIPGSAFEAVETGPILH